MTKLNDFCIKTNNPYQKIQCFKREFKINILIVLIIFLLVLIGLIIFLLRKQKKTSLLLIKIVERNRLIQNQLKEQDKIKTCKNYNCKTGNLVNNSHRYMCPNNKCDDKNCCNKTCQNYSCNVGKLIPTNICNGENGCNDNDCCTPITCAS